MTQENNKRIIDELIDLFVNTSPKIFSGRFLLTVVGALCFYNITRMACELLLSKAADLDISHIISLLTTILLVISNVFTFYFVKNTMNQIKPNDTQKQNLTDETENR